MSATFHLQSVWNSPRAGDPSGMNTRTIAVAALVIAVILLLVLVL
jgi:hypothetical protein